MLHRGWKLTWAALSSRPLRSLSKTSSQPSNALGKFQVVAAWPELDASFPEVAACRETTKVARNGSKSLTKRVLRAARSSST